MTNATQSESLPRCRHDYHVESPSRIDKKFMGMSDAYAVIASRE